MSDLARGAVAALKGQAGLPTGVKLEAASPAVPSTPIVEPVGTPAQQEAQAAELVARIRQGAPAVTQSPAEAILAAKDAAIKDQGERIEKLTQMSQNTTDKVEQLLNQLSAPTEANKPQELNLPGLPEGIEDLPAEEQLRIQSETINSLRSEVKNVLQERDDGLKKLLSPLAKEVGQMKQERDKKSVQDTFPNFDYDSNLEAMLQYQAETGWTSTMAEAASVVGGRTDPKSLLPNEASIPHVESSRPSASMAAGVPGADPINAPADPATVSRQIRDAIVVAQQSGNNLRAQELQQEYLKNKLFGKR